LNQNSSTTNPPPTSTVGAGFWLTDGSYVTLREFVRRRLAEAGHDQNWLAAQMGVSSGTLSTILNAGREAKISQLDTMASALGVNIVILLRLCGYGSATTKASTAPTGEIIGDGAVRFYDDAERISAPRVQGPVDLLDGCGFVVRTNSTGPRYLPGEVVWTETPLTTHPDQLLARPCIITLCDGQHVLRTPLLSAMPNRYTLLAPHGALTTDVEVLSGAAIVRITAA